MLHSLIDVDARSNRVVAEWLEQNTPQGESIHVWGFESVIYHLADRRPASRFIYNVPQRAKWSSARSRGELMDDLEKSRPFAIVVVSDDPLRIVTGNRRDSRQTLLDFAALNELLANYYRSEKIVGDMEISSCGRARNGGSALDTAIPSPWMGGVGRAIFGYNDR